MVQSATSPRDTLRTATDAAHARTDAAFSAIDLATVEGRGRFLAAQGFGFEAVRRAFAAHGETAWEAAARARRDAALADADPMLLLGLPGADLSGHDPLGVAYVAAGSLHGAGILRARLQRSGLRRLPVFFARRRAGDAGDLRPVWSEVLARLDAADPGRLPALVRAAEATFAAFAAPLSRPGALRAPRTTSTTAA